eukprot:jgi/Phyca11/538348/estExt2_Genewise1Plus.C_PHYCAscaffold_10953
MGKKEAEWVEKQLQYKARVATLEKDCRISWQSFFAGAGTSTCSSSTTFVSAAEINKLAEEMDAVRERDVNKMKHELSKLRNKVNIVQMKVLEIENGKQFFSELQKAVDTVEAALGKFQLLQRKQFEECALEEKIVEKDLAIFMEKMDSWGNEAVPQLSRGGANEDPAVRLGTLDELGMVDRVRSLNDAILRSGGLQGTWDHREHSTFATLLVSTDYETRVSRFFRKCMRKIVTQTEITIRSHFEWYLQHLKLVEEKKRVIQEWKTRKEEERQQIVQTKLKSREKTDRLLLQWKKEKKQKDEEREQRRRELQMKRDAIEAKRKQERLDAKQKILLYKLQKEQEAMMLEHLDERSRIAIEYAKTKRLRLQQIEERIQKRKQLPPRPENNDSTSPKPVLLFNSTEASKARDFSKEQVRQIERQRKRQSAHDAYIPGQKVIPDVKFKSFGHIPIQPRAVPAWRKNI